MKKGKIAFVAIITAMTAISMANAETASKLMRNPGFYPTPAAEDSLQTDDCCGHKVPKGTCMAVCVGNQFTDLEQIQDRANSSSPATLGNLTGTTEKISSINMEKNFSEAGNVLASFYSGSKAKGNSDSVVYAELGTSPRSSAKTEKEICNAKPAKIILAGKVPPLNNTSKDSKKTSSLPLAAGGLALGGVSLLAAVSGKKKSYSDDAETVWNAIQHPIDTYNDIHNYDSNMENYNNSTHHSNNSNNQNNSSANPYEIEQDAATTLHCDPTGTCTQ